MTATALNRSRYVQRQSPLTELLQHYRVKANRSQADVARDAWLDESYVSRLFSGDRTNPSRDALILLSAFGLRLSVAETDEILDAGDYKQLALPQSLR